MLSKARTKLFTRHAPMLILVLLTLIVNGMLSPVAASPLPQDSSSGVEPDAGTWQTWILSSGDQLRLDAPPDDAATADEIAELKAMAANRDDAALQQIAYWDSGSAVYRWNQIGTDYIAGHVIPLAGRDWALLNVALYDATIAAWDSKYAYNRPRPSEVDPSLSTVIANPSSPSYPSEYAVAAGAASTVLAWLFPDDAQMFADLAQEAVNSRLLAGVEYPSDVEAGLELGRQVAELVIEYGNADGSNVVWDGTMPTEPGHWTGQNPIFPMQGSWATYVLTSGDQFRPAPPPAYDSEQMAAEMDELRTFERTPRTNSLAQWWEYGAGGRRNYWYWNLIASQLILEANWKDNTPRAARAYALVSIANYEAGVATWDAKYTYWAIRPTQLDPEYTPLFTTPNHPSYPSAHSALSTSIADTLAYLFPADAEWVRGMATEASESRIWAGIHFRSDIDAGVMLGHNVAGALLERAANDGS
jgi:membrane-associated phospholipid phosphatase